MIKKYLYVLTLSFSLGFSANIGIEYSGVVVTTNSKKEQKSIVVKRNIPKECNNVPITNEMLWTENFAHKSVPEVCKSTYVHTKGKLLPIQLGSEDLETYGELEVLIHLRQMQRDDTLLLVDSRKKDWFKYRTIPGAVNMPFIYFKQKDEYEFEYEYALLRIGVYTLKNGDYDFSKAKTLAIFCNGPWCTQSATMINALLAIGYPEEKLKWYRGGMQDWLGAGMTSTREINLPSTI
ncbi:MAG: rhodanese-like domain-containing protein [Campylobacterota bacterium]|nr:rhodanese-like domain-containing protein [Campylobacterota bacterium]